MAADDGNRIVAGLSPDLRAKVEAAAETVRFEADVRVALACRPTAEVHFVVSGFLSAMLSNCDRSGVEVGLIGREGMTGAWLALGEMTTPFDLVARTPVRAIRLPASILLELCRRHPELSRAALAYCHRFTAMIAETCQAQARLTVEGRLARWLLLARERLDDDALSITHDALAKMLGVRRPGITVALHVLEGEHMVRATRGRICILDREKLARVARGLLRDDVAREPERRVAFV